MLVIFLKYTKAISAFTGVNKDTKNTSQRFVVIFSSGLWRTKILFSGYNYRHCSEPITTCVGPKFVATVCVKPILVLLTSRMINSLASRELMLSRLPEEVRVLMRSCMLFLRGFSPLLSWYLSMLSFWNDHSDRAANTWQHVRIEKVMITVWALLCIKWNPTK